MHSAGPPIGERSMVTISIALSSVTFTLKKEVVVPSLGIVGGFADGDVTIGGVVSLSVPPPPPPLAELSNLIADIQSLSISPSVFVNSVHVMTPPVVGSKSKCIICG